MEGKYISYRVCGTQWANNNLLCASNSLFISRTGFSRLIFFLGTFVEQRSGGAPLPYAIISQMQLQTSARARSCILTTDRMHVMHMRLLMFDSGIGAAAGTQCRE